MEVNSVPEVKLNSGHKMPLIGLGTGSFPNPTDDELVSIYLDAIKAGYRHFDTAVLYQTEEPIGRAVAQALELGLVKSRAQLFITSKLWCSSAHHDLVLPALRDSLMTLGLDYVDLYLIHWPVRLKTDAHPFDLSKDDILPFDIQKTWEAMEECSKLGLAKSIGVSNFSSHKLAKILQHATIPPAVNQVEMNASWQQQKMLTLCKDNGIYLSAYSPLGANGASWGSLAVMESTVLKKIADARGKSLVQVALRWIYEQGACIIVKSYNKGRMRENIEIFNWDLTADDLAQIQTIPQRRSCLGVNFVSPSGPYKSLEELWDGDEFKT